MQTVTHNTQHANRSCDVISGHLHVLAVIAHLRETRALGAASDVLLSGGSAGGIGTLLNLDSVAEALPGVRVTGLPMGGWFMFAGAFNATSGQNYTSNVSRWDETVRAILPLDPSLASEHRRPYLSPLRHLTASTASCPLSCDHSTLHAKPTPNPRQTHAKPTPHSGAGWLASGAPFSLAPASAAWLPSACPRLAASRARTATRASRPPSSWPRISSTGTAVLRNKGHRTEQGGAQ